MKTTTLDSEIKKEHIQLGRGNIISSRDISRNPGDYPIYSSSAKGMGEFGRYGDYMFDEELITWSVDGGGRFFYRPKHKFSVTNVSGFMRIDAEVWNRRFVYYSLDLQHKKFAFDYQMKAHPSVIRHLYELVEFRKPEQAKIAEVLSTVDQAIEQTEALIAKTQQIKAGLMHDLFTRGVTPDGQLRPPCEEAPHLYKESPLGWIPKEWSIRRLDDLATINRGKFSIRPRNDPRYYGGQFPFIQTGDVAIAAGRRISQFSQTLNNLGSSVSRMFPVDTIMVTIAANIADTCILQVPMFAPDSLVGVSPNDGESERFLQLSISRRKRWFENRAPQTAQKNINLEDLRPLLIPYPEKAEQSKTTNLYEAVEDELTSYEREAEKMRLLKAGLMAELLSGRVKVFI